MSDPGAARNTRSAVLFVVMGILLLVPLATHAQTSIPQTPVLEEVYTPYFRALPPPDPPGRTIAYMWNQLGTPRGHGFIRALLPSWSGVLPSQSGVLWLSLAVLLAVGIDFTRPGNPRNLDLLIAQAVGSCLFGVMWFFDLDLPHLPAYVTLMHWVFAAVFVLTVTLLVRAVWRVYWPNTSLWRPNLPLGALMVVAGLLIGWNLFIALVRAPDDSGYFVNLGAQRLRERWRLPYGDPLLTGSPAAAYGPLLYFAHLPFQVLVAPSGANAVSPDLPRLGPDAGYFIPPLLATKLCTMAFHVVGVAALYYSVRRLAGRQAAWGIVALYAGSVAVLGIGGDNVSINGMTFVSHIAPAATTLLAFACLEYPGVAGVLLVAAAGVGLYPIFLGPAWLGFYWDHPRARTRFLVAVLMAGLFLTSVTLALSRPANGRGRVGTVVHDVVGHHTDPVGYGRSPFGFWGQRGGVRQTLITPLVPGTGITSPTFLALVALSAAAFLVARRRRPWQLSLLTAVLSAAFALTKVHATGTYLAWFYPFLLIGLLTGTADQGGDHNNEARGVPAEGAS